MCNLKCFFVLVLVTVITACDSAEECKGENMVYDPCPKNRPIYCEDVLNPSDCDEDEECKPRCRCADGYLINYDQKCIREKDCLRCKRPNEYFSCGSACDRWCDNLSGKCNIVSKECSEQCYCKDGFARNQTGVCIPIKECKLPTCKDPNAIYRYCKTCPGTCWRPNSGGCATQSCVPGCSCKDGYVRVSNSNSTCISLPDCKKICPANEYFACGSACDRSCDNLSGKCKNDKNTCTDRCYCIENYLRNKKGVCVTIDKCGFPKCKDPNAEYRACKRCVGSCENRDVVCTAECSPGCACKFGYVRASNKNDTCVKESECKDKRCPKKNEYYSSCISNCPSICPDQNGGRACTASASSCKPGCECIEGYLISKNGSCIAPKDCPPFVCDLRPNEIYSKCGENCTQSCSSLLGQEPLYCKQKINTDYHCYPECICKKGYVRGGGYRCVPQNKCGICKDPNEEYWDCGTACELSCQDQNRTCDTPCKPGCLCKSLFIRNYGKCIPFTDCPAEETN